MGITTIGVGVIVIDPETGCARSKFRTDRGIYHESDSAGATQLALWNFQAEIDRLITPIEPLNLAGQHTLSSYLEFVSGHWQNIIQVHSMQSMDASNLNTAVDLLFSALIGEFSTEHSHHDVRHVRRNVRGTYRRFPRLERATIFDTNVRVARRELDLTLAVVDEGNVIELNQAFNFQSTDPRGTRSAIDAWTLKIDKLIQEGGELSAHGPITLDPRGSSIVAVTTEPNSAAQQENYLEFQEFCRDLDIMVLNEEDVPQHAARLDERLAS
ncbi:hypothetical protein G7Y31_00585 [Corynebacterium lizhenjunii]|uniref:DUF3037 domain-containing protein n=1 Tax=Corynebacterium lizhenjunii TaxID=2709394 RepID=A0A7T0KED4_9CORY|nr:hypothetical protein [Corynebacterium lizhenjunii]QPK79266.1 hypothetical protein G7Y31_00585 [Corynebacterium lizhenjunii]